MEEIWQAAAQAAAKGGREDGRSSRDLAGKEGQPEEGEDGPAGRILEAEMRPLVGSGQRRRALCWRPVVSSGR
jgi:hypothetical protein